MQIAGIGFPESLDSRAEARPVTHGETFPPFSLSLFFLFVFPRRRVIPLSLFGSPKWPHAASVASSWYKYIWELGRCPEPRPPSHSVYDPSSSLIPLPGSVVYESRTRTFFLRESLMIPLFHSHYPFVSKIQYFISLNSFSLSNNLRQNVTFHWCLIQSFPYVLRISGFRCPNLKPRENLMKASHSSLPKCREGCGRRRAKEKKKRKEKRTSLAADRSRDVD